jgi:hypothetical protein
MGFFGANFVKVAEDLPAWRLLACIKMMLGGSKHRESRYEVDAQSLRC